MRTALLVLLWLSTTGVVLALTARVLRAGHDEDVRLGYDEHEPPRRRYDLPAPRAAADDHVIFVPAPRPYDG